MSIDNEQVSPPRTFTPFKKDPNKRYLLVQKESARWDGSKLQETLEMPSPTDPSKPMYSIALSGENAEGRGVVGNSHMFMLECSVEDSIALEKQNEAFVKSRSRDVANDGVESSVSGVIRVSKN